MSQSSAVAQQHGTYSCTVTAQSQLTHRHERRRDTPPGSSIHYCIVVILCLLSQTPYRHPAPTQPQTAMPCNVLRSRAFRSNTTCATCDACRHPFENPRAGLARVRRPHCTCLLREIVRADERLSVPSTCTKECLLRDSSCAIQDRSTEMPTRVAQANLPATRIFFPCMALIKDSLMCSPGNVNSQTLPLTACTSIGCELLL